MNQYLDKLKHIPEVRGPNLLTEANAVLRRLKEDQERQITLKNMLSSLAKRLSLSNPSSYLMCTTSYPEMPSLLSLNCMIEVNRKVLKAVNARSSHPKTEICLKLDYLPRSLTLPPTPEPEPGNAIKILSPAQEKLQAR